MSQNIEPAQSQINVEDSVCYIMICDALSGLCIKLNVVVLADTSYNNEVVSRLFSLFPILSLTFTCINIISGSLFFSAFSVLSPQPSHTSATVSSYFCFSCNHRSFASRLILLLYFSFHFFSSASFLCLFLYALLCLHSPLLLFLSYFSASF